MIRQLALFVSLSAFAGAAAADCSAGHSEKDAKATSDTVLASRAPVDRSSTPAALARRDAACANGNCGRVAKPASDVSKAKKAVPVAERDRVAVAVQPTR